MNTDFSQEELIDVAYALGSNAPTEFNWIFSDYAKETKPEGKSIIRSKSSDYRGVSFNHKSQKWKAVITVNKKQSFLGYYDSEFEAAQRYDEASKEYRGPEAKTNFGSNKFLGDHGRARKKKNINTSKIVPKKDDALASPRKKVKKNLHLDSKELPRMNSMDMMSPTSAELVMRSRQLHM